MILTSDAASPWHGRRVLVTGATGFVGGQVARQGLAAGVEVHAFGRRPGPAGVVDHFGDLCDPASVATAVRAVSPDLVIHAASPGVAFGTAEFLTILTALTLGNEALLEACATLPAPPAVVHIGSGLEYTPQPRPTREDDPLVPSGSRYGAAKAASAAVTGSFAGRLKIALVRPFNIYGAPDTAPRLGSLVIDAARAGEPLPLSPGEQQRDFLHVDDCAAAIWSAATMLGGTGPSFEVLNLGSGEAVSLRAFVEQIAAALARRGLASDLRFGGIAYRPGEPMVSLPDLTRTFARLTWRPRVGLGEGIDDYVGWSLARCG